MGQGKNTKIDDYKTVMRRIYPVTKIENPTQLSKIIGIPQATVNRKKNQNKFEIEWAYLLASHFDLSTEWILTGREKIINDNYLLTVEDWLKDIIQEDSRNRDWFERQIEKMFPEFIEWKKNREAEKKKRKVA